MKILLHRDKTGTEGTFGVLYIDGKSFSYTLERPWLDNKSGVSCIPQGTYRVKWTHSPKYCRKMYLIDQVKGRTGIRIHSANLAKQLQGCVALGEKLGSIDGVKALLVSKPAVRRFEELLGGKEFELEITGVC